jgi:hypothetical protein
MKNEDTAIIELLDEKGEVGDWARQIAISVIFDAVRCARYGNRQRRRKELGWLIDQIKNNGLYWVLADMGDVGILDVIHGADKYYRSRLGKAGRPRKSNNNGKENGNGKR